ncbi:MAG: rod shape-determining protein MreB [Desulfovibrionales bacterium]|nr:rod shape-determining protein MreB [Desulfovibrionales bacterium]
MFKRLLAMFGKDLAMDLGTANSLLYTPKEGIVLNEPSVVALSNKDGRIIAVGKEAKDYLGRTPERIRAVRPMKDGVIADFETTKQMITFFIRKVIKGLSLVKPHIVICVPTGITQVEMRAVIEAGEQAGAREVKLIEEPMAAAIGAGLPIMEPLGNMVVDIGGGTTEVAVISLGAIAYAESIRVAGDEMNEAIQRYFQDEFKTQIGENKAEWVKMQIGSACELDQPLNLEVAGKNLLTGTPHILNVTDAHIREAIREPVNAIVNAVRTALERTPPELAADLYDRGLLLAGGGALLKNLDVRINKVTGLKVNIDEDPLTAIVRGTGKTLDKNSQFQKVYIN